jgi:lipopolysaccharide transport system permease protein
MSDTLPYTHIKSKQAAADYWAEIYRYRSLMYYLAWRDVLLRYKQTVMGILWSVIRPLFTMVVFTIVFHKVAKLPSGELPYPVLVMSGLIAWQLFSAALSSVGESLLSNAALISKVYFPRMIAPFSSLIVALLDFAIALGLMILILLYYGIMPGWQILTLPFFIVLALMPALGVGMFLATLNVKYRDFRYIIPFIIQLGFFISPVGFDSAIVPDEWRLLYSVNPMVGVIEGFRWALSAGSFNIYIPGFIMSVGLSILSLIAGYVVFRKRENHFADVI